VKKLRTSYNFTEDNSDMKFVRRTQQTRISIILLLITSGLQIITSVLTTFVPNGFDLDGDHSVAIAIWVIELLSLLINFPALILLLLGLKELRVKIENTRKSYFTAATVFLSIHLVSYLVSTIVLLISDASFQFEHGVLIAKDLMCFMFLSFSLLFISLAFNKIQKKGYPTRLLLSPLILLPLIAVVGFVFGWIEASSATVAGSMGGRGFIYYAVISLFIYLAIALFISLWEVFHSVNILHNQILLNLAPELLQKEEKKKTEAEKVTKVKEAVIGK